MIGRLFFTSLLRLLHNLVLIMLVIFVLMLISEGTIRYRLRDLDLDDTQQALNDKLKIHAVKTVPGKHNVFAIDFVNIPYYGKEKNSGDTIKTKPKQGTSRYFAYASIISNIK